ncbi:hypothetical protein A2933_01065 [Candidatus Nomurabacteria bacterium RIFCSPLOWO2_01_FULL_46_18]|uniref:Uncharacterized protein n=1 Tax=Candidatus Nomurabacteria bacterium RIFCSPLOWO2_01_FULL_46_18 TaxID=1801783 RepID=A0A1F6XEE7_9BACT|nr:MAG: hypothetical protein A2933_01065 [Candidatus Nomurabacteria bacterium RIFCSPLOWO2_01_FULL_46_18]
MTQDKGLPVITKSRECGSCTACCKTHQILELEKPAGVWCEHCNIGHGCNIYGDHPQGCKDFACEWLNGLLAEADRPDKTKIVLDYLDLKDAGRITGRIFALFEVSEGALSGKFAENLTTSILLQNGVVFHFPINGNNKLLFMGGGADLPEKLSIRINGKNTDVIPIQRR